MNVQHVILTRFALKSKGTGFSGEFPPGWLEERFNLFESYCLPAVQGQTCAKFEWLLFVHKDFATGDEERLRAYDPRISVVRGGRNMVAKFVKPDTDVFVSSRLDSDDALHREFSRRVRRHASAFYESERDAQLHNFPNGFKLDANTGLGYPSFKPNSAFVSLFERPQAGRRIETAFARNHSVMPNYYPTIQDKSLAGWLIVVHGGNVLNGIGTRELSKAFPFEQIADDYNLCGS